VTLAAPTAHATDGEGGSDPVCIVMGGYRGECTNTGRVVEGTIYGCATDLAGVYHYATLGASFHGGAIRMIVHRPWYDKETFWNGSKSDHSVEWNDGKSLSAAGISFSMIREPGSPSAWIQRAWVRCCDCGERAKGSDMVQRPTVARLP
jgi:hypothetical protein